MMRIFFSFFVLILLSGNALGQAPAFTSLAKALKDPASVRTLDLDLADSRVAQLYTVANAMQDLEEVRVTNYLMPVQLKTLFSALRNHPKLETVTVFTTSLTGIPDEINALVALKTLNVYTKTNLENPIAAYLVDRVREGENDVKINIYAEFPTNETEENHLVMLFPTAVVHAINTRQPVDFTFRPIEDVTAPIEGLDVGKASYSLNAESGSKIYHSSGTTMEVPANAFVDANGNPVNGEVKITYRELNDPVSMMVSGVPMSYDSGGTQGFLESAGMFELRAFDASGNELRLDQGKKIDMQLATTDDASNYQFYKFDEENGRWVYEDNNVNVITKDPAQPLSNAWAIFTYYKQSLMENTFDGSTYEERFESDTYSYLFPKERDDAMTVREEQYGLAKKYVHWVREPELAANAVALEGDKSFAFELKANPASWPELRAFKKVAFKGDAHLTAKSFRKQLEGKVIHDVRLRKDEDSGVYTMVFKVSDGKIEMEVTPVGISEQMSEAKVDAAVKKYFVYHQKKANAFNKSVARMQHRYERDANRAWGVVEYHMSEAERTMTFETWKAYARVMDKNFGYTWNFAPRSPQEIMDRISETERNGRRNQRRASLSRRNFSIAGSLGFINVDIFVNPFRAPRPDEVLASANDLKGEDRPVTVRATFRNENDEVMHIKKVYVFEEGYNGVLHYAPQKDARSTTILFNPAYKTTIVAIDVHGNLSMLKPREVGKLAADYNMSMSNDLVMKPIKENFEDVESLRKALNL